MQSYNNPFKSLVKQIKRIRKTLENDVFPERNEVFLWTSENFARLEETVVNGCKFTKSKRKSDLKDFFYIFDDILMKNLPETKEEIEACFDNVNQKEEVKIENASCFKTLFSLAICKNIADCFENQSDFEPDRIKRLFAVLDTMPCVENSAQFRNNICELVLCRDPYNLYTNLSDATKASYRKNLSVLAKKHKTKEHILAERIVENCKKNDGEKRHIGCYLCDKPRGGRAYLFLLGFVTLLFTLLLSVVSPIFLLAAVPVYFCSKVLLDKFYLRFVPSSFCLPEINLEKIPEKHGVLVVVTCLLTGNDEGLFERLSDIYHSCDGENVYFGILADLPDSDEKMTKNDREIIYKANEKILLLRKKYGDKFFLFFREKVYSESEEKYIPPERKRGAVCALSELLCLKEDLFCHGSIKPDDSACRNIRYVLTLDADTNPAFDCIKKLVGIMMHPQNKPYFDEKKKAVTKGYGIIQPAVSSTLLSANSSFFSSVMSGGGGVDNYSFGGSDRNMSLFGRSFFCGKGMFEKNVFCRALCGENAFENDKILSHDAPEGARLRCAHVPDVTFTDSFPREELSYYKRKHRWIRGDFQNIPFLFKNVATADGGRITNSIGIFSRFFLFENIMSALLPLFSLLLLFLSCFVGKNASVLMVSVCVSAYVLPFANSALSVAKRHIFQNLKRLFYSKGVYTGFYVSFMQLLFHVASIPQSAYISADAIARSLWRSCVTKRKTLEWTTSAANDAEKHDGLLGYVKKNLFSALCGAVLFLISKIGFVRLIALLWLFMPVFAYHSGKKQSKQSSHITKSEKEILYGYMSDMWKFFSENVGEKTNFLPPDNLRFFPDTAMSRMTSPTNIGLYLLSVVCAAKTGILDYAKAEKMLLDTLSCICELEKVDGILYNWYDIFTKRPMPDKYLSSVDMGNFVACAVAVKGAVEEFSGCMKEPEKIIKQLDELIDGADLSLLYDKNTNLFFIGAYVTERGIVFDKNRYDMLMSEARILSFTAVAKKKVPREHLKHLSRQLVEGGNYIGLASWSGTVFEYFMPEIFFESKKGSLIYEALCFCHDFSLKNGIFTKEGFVFGISESCYNDFDDSSNYKYYAFGIDKIALSSIKTHRIYSPYSAFLTMPMSRKISIDCLESMKKLGAYGIYGFYDSIDFENVKGNDSFSSVRCSMAHHIGMSIAACTNELYDGAVRSWFLKDKSVKSAMELTEEKIPHDTYAAKIPRRHLAQRENINKPHAVRCEKTNSAELSLGSLRIYAKRGEVKLTRKNAEISLKKVFPESLSSLGIQICFDGQSVIFDKNFDIFSDKGRIVFSKKVILKNGCKYECRAAFTLQKNVGELFRILVKAKRISGKAVGKIYAKIKLSSFADTKENKDKCLWFDENAPIPYLDKTGKVLATSDAEQNLYMYASFIGKENCRAELCDGICRFEGNMKNVGETSMAEFCISLSPSEKCAETALFRAYEKTFDEVAKTLSEKPENLSSVKSPHLRPMPPKGVMGVSETKEKRLAFPLDSRQGSMSLLAGRDFACLMSDKNLGFSFAKDAKNGCVTVFGRVSEKLYFADNEGFDLCRNSEKFRFEKGAYFYEGNYMSDPYFVKVFIPEYGRYKIIKVTTKSDIPLALEITPSGRLCKNVCVGSGLVRFSAFDEEKGGFAFGIVKTKDGKCGSEYDICPEISVVFSKEDVKNREQKTYIFCIGFEKTNKVDESFSHVWENVDITEKEAEIFGEKLKIDYDLMPKNLHKTLSEYFVFPKDARAVRSLVATSKTLSCFDVLLSVYTKKDHVLSDISKSLFSETGSLCVFLLCIALSEYARLYGNFFADYEYEGKNVYKHCLFLLFEKSAKIKKEPLFLPLCTVALEYFSRLCQKIGDIRTQVELQSIAEDLKKRNCGGIFL